MKCQYQTLVEKAKKGDKESMAQLIQNMHPLIYSAIRRYGKDSDKEDLYQEACIILIESVYSYEPERGVAFLTYIKKRIYYGIFNRTRNNTCYVSINQPLEDGETNTLEDIIEDPNAQVEQKIIDNEEKDRLMSAISHLSPKQRQVIELHYMSGMTLKDIAKARGVHYKGVLRLKDRALKKLAEIIN